MALISCGELSFLILLPIINSLLNFSNFEIYKKTQFINHPITDCLLSNCILCFSFIPLLFTKLCCNSKKNKQKSHVRPTLAIKVNNITMFTIVIGFLYQITNLLHSIVGNQIATTKNFFVNDYIFELFFIVIASKIFSKSLIYKHQQISIVFIILLSCGFYAIDFIFYFKGQEYIVIFLIVKQIIFGIYIVLIKHLTEFKKYSIFKMLLTFGIVGLVVDLIILMITSNIECNGYLDGICSATYNYKTEHKYERINLNEKDISILDINISDYEEISKITNIKNITNVEMIDNYTIGINFTNIINETSYYLDNINVFINNTKNNIEYHHGIIQSTIINLMYRIFSITSIFLCVIVVEKLFPSYTYFTNILLSIISKLKDIIYIKEKDDLLIYIQILIICFIFFWTLVYNEIIELNFCGCSDDTRKNKISQHDELRKSDWVTDKGIMDADATVVDDINNDITHLRENDGNYGTLATVNSYMK